MHKACPLYCEWLEWNGYQYHVNGDNFGQIKMVMNGQAGCSIRKK